MNNILDKIKRVKSYSSSLKDWRNDFNSVEYKEASELNQYFFGMPLNRQKNCDCVNDLMNYLLNLKQTQIDKIKKVMESKFKLKKGIFIQLHNVDVLTEANLTDEKAINLLKKYPSHIQSFEVVPDNWEDLVNENIKPKKTTPKKESIEDADEGLPTERKGKRGRPRNK